MNNFNPILGELLCFRAKTMPQIKGKTVGRCNNDTHPKGVLISFIGCHINSKLSISSTTYNSVGWIRLCVMLGVTKFFFIVLIYPLCIVKLRDHLLPIDKWQPRWVPQHLSYLFWEKYFAGVNHPDPFQYSCDWISEKHRKFCQRKQHQDWRICFKQFWATWWWREAIFNCWRIRGV